MSGEAVPLPPEADRAESSHAFRIRLLIKLLGSNATYARNVAVSSDGATYARASGNVVAIFASARCATPDEFGHRIPLDGTIAMARLEGHNSEVLCVGFSPDGTILASASDDFTVRLWDMVPLHRRRAKARQ